VLITDSDSLHIIEHKVVLADPDARMQPNVVESVTSHLQEHIRNLRTKDPVLAAALKQPAGPGPAPSPEGAPPPPAEPIADPTQLELPVANPETGQPAVVNGPTNPLTGEQAPIA